MPTGLLDDKVRGGGCLPQPADRPVSELIWDQGCPAEICSITHQPWTQTLINSYFRRRSLAWFVMQY